MRVLNIVKYYEPSNGGMEMVVKNIVEGIINISKDVNFTVYSNNHLPAYKAIINNSERILSIKERTPFFLKSQPLNIGYPSLKKLLEQADIVHHHYPFPNMELALLRHKKILKQKKLLITWHANIKNSRWKWIEKSYNPLMKELLDIASDIIVTSPQLFDNSMILNGYKNKVQVIPLSFDPMFSRPMSERKYPVGRNLKILFVGKLRAYKGVQYLIGAIKDMNVELTIVGDGECEQDLVTQVDLNSLQNKVTFLKGVSNQQLVEIYKNSDIFVLPSTNEAEAFGIVQLEAMSMGLPVINTKLNSGVPFVSLDGVTGITVEPQNTSALRMAIASMIENKELYEQMSRNAIERATKFSRNKMAHSYWDIYNKYFE